MCYASHSLTVPPLRTRRSCASVDADVDADEAEPSLRPAATPQAPSAAAAAAALATTATPKAPDAVTAVRRCCRLLVTESSEDKRRPRYIYERWFPPQATFVVTPSPGDAGELATGVCVFARMGIFSQGSTPVGGLMWL